MNAAIPDLEPPREDVPSDAPACLVKERHRRARASRGNSRRSWHSIVKKRIISRSRLLVIAGRTKSFALGWRNGNAPFSSNSMKR